MRHPSRKGDFVTTFFARRQVDGSDDDYPREDIYLMHDNTDGEGW